MVLPSVDPRDSRDPRYQSRLQDPMMVPVGMGYTYGPWLYHVPPEMVQFKLGKMMTNHDSLSTFGVF